MSRHGRLQQFQARSATLSDADVEAMIAPEVLAELRKGGAHPTIRAYSVGHEGRSEGGMDGGRAKAFAQWAAGTVRKLHGAVQMLTPVFDGHTRSDNSTDGRTEIGRVVGKALRTIGGVLHSVTAIHVDPAFTDRKLDCASIEAFCKYRNRSGGRVEVTRIDEITGIALGNSDVERPAFPGATLVGAFQAFRSDDEDGRRQTMNKAELMEEIRNGGYSPADLFAPAVLETDTMVKQLIANASVDPLARIKDADGKIAAQAAEHQKAVDVLTTENKALKAGVSKHQAGSTLATVIKGREGITDRQTAYLQKEIASFSTEADPMNAEAFGQAVGKFVDDGLARYQELAKIMGVPEGSSGGGAPSSEDKGFSVSEEEKIFQPG